MRDFQRKPGHIAALPFGARVLYSIWLTFALVALIVAASLYQDGPTLSAEEVGIYYAGGLVSDGETAFAPRSADGPVVELPGGAPVVELPGDAPVVELPSDAPALDLVGLHDPLGAGDSAGGSAMATRIAVEFNRRRLLEVTHGHLFVMPLFYLVIAHIFVLVGLPQKLTATFVVGGALSIAGHIAGPWLVRDGSTAWAPIVPISGVAMLLSLGGMAAISLVALWLPRRRSAATSSGST